MGFFDRFKTGKSVVVIDGLSLNESLGMKGKVAPRNQLQLLRRLARFAEREKVGMVIVLSGTPLHKAPANKEFEGVAILYSKSPEVHTKLVTSTAASKGAGAVVISANQEIENAVLGRGLRVMRVSTFRKAFDVGGNAGENNNRSDRNGGERSNNRNRSPRRRSPEKTTNEKKEEPSAKKESAPKESTPSKPRPPKKNDSTNNDAAINELIDLID